MFLSLLLAAPLLPQASDDWLLVRSEAKQIGTISWEKIRDVYLPGRKVRIVPGAEGESTPSASRLVVGTPRDNPAVVRIAAELGIRYGDGQISWRGHTYGPGTGLIVATADPDGQGRIALFTGADSMGVINGFSISVSPFDDA